MLWKLPVHGPKKWISPVAAGHIETNHKSLTCVNTRSHTLRLLRHGSKDLGMVAKTMTSL